MLAQSQTAVLSPIQFFLFAGGLPLLACGITFSLWGLWNIVRPRNASPILSQIVLSLIPGIIAMAGIYVACTEFTEMASLTTPPKPAVFAGVAGRAMSYGFMGLLSTIVPVLLGVVAVRKHLQSLRNESSNPTT